MTYVADGKPHYISRSWDMLTRDKGWIKVILLLALASFVPFVGLIGLVGYGLEWARLTAWGIDSSPKQHGVRIGECLASGWRALVVTFVWMFVWMLAVAIVNSIADVLLPDALASLIGSLLVLAQLFYILVVYVAVLRAAIYTKISAGLNPSRVFEMVKRAPGDLFFFVLIPIVGGLIVSAIWIFFMLLGGVSVLPEIIKMARAATGSFDDAMFIRHLTAMLRVVMPIAAIAGYLSSVVNAATSLLSYNAVGLWMRQFDVARWGGPSESPSAGRLSSHVYGSADHARCWRWLPRPAAACDVCAACESVLSGARCAAVSADDEPAIPGAGGPNVSGAGGAGMPADDGSRDRSCAIATGPRGVNACLRPDGSRSGSGSHAHPGAGSRRRFDERDACPDRSAGDGGSAE